MTILRGSQLMILLALGAFTGACSDDGGEPGNLAGSGNQDPQGQAGAPNEDIKPGKKPGKENPGDNKEPEEKDEEELLKELDARCDPEATPLGGGEGTEESPYLICAVEQLTQWSELFEETPLFQTGHFALTRDLDFEEEQLRPIGGHPSPGTDRMTVPFLGVFKGHKRTISRLNVTQGFMATGLFAELGKTGRVSQLNLQGEVNGGQNVGALAGVASGWISEVHFDGRVFGHEMVGGLVGLAIDNCTLRDSSTRGSVSGGAWVGGLIGEMERSVLHGSHSSSEVSGRGDRVGGAVGKSRESTVRRVTTSGAVSGREQVGGAFGLTWGTMALEVLAEGTVNGGDKVGGMVGWSDLYCSWIFSEARASVTGSVSIGGFAGASTGSSFEQVSASGRVIGSSHVGGLIGSGGSDSLVMNSYSIGNVTGKEDVGGLIGHTQAAAQVQNSYAIGLLSPAAGETEIVRGGGLIGTAMNTGSSQGSYFLDGSYDNLVGTLLSQEQFGQASSFVDWDFDRFWSWEEGVTPFARPTLRPSGL